MATRAAADSNTSTPPTDPRSILRYHPGARWIEETRVLLGWSNNELASRLGLSPSYITKVRHGDKPITPRIIARIGRLLAAEERGA